MTSTALATRPRVARRPDAQMVVCLATGPSLTAEDVDYCHGKAVVIAVNDAYRLAPWADVLIANDAAWWRVHRGVPDFAGEKYCLEASAATSGAVTVLDYTGETGIETEPTGLRSGRCSGGAAINVALHLGATRIVLLGYDMRGDHFFGRHPAPLRTTQPHQFETFRDALATMADPLHRLGVSVINCTPASALTCFPSGDLRAVLR